MAGPDSNYWKLYLQATQKLFDADLREVAQQSTADQTNAYADALGAWWGKVSPESPPATQQLFEKLIEQGAAYFKFAEHLNPDGGSTGKDATENWTSSALGILSQLEHAFSQPSTQQAASIDPVKKLVEQPLAAWQVFADSVANGNLGPQTLLSTLAASPALGINRESQLLVQQYLEKELEYQRVLAKYQQFHTAVGIKSCERLNSALSQTDSNRQKTFRAVYNLWVEVCEGVYAKEVATEVFSELYGKLVNAMMSLRHARQKLVDKTLAELGLPTRQHSEALTQSLQGLRRQQKLDQKEVGRLQLRCDQLEMTIAKSAGQAAPSNRAKSRSPKSRTAKSSKGKKSSKTARVKPPVKRP